MLENIKYLTERLIEVRKSLKMRQSRVAQSVGIPQSHLSKIESGLVNVKLGNFVELARTLGLEVMLVPKKEVSFVLGIVASGKEGGEALKPAYTVDEESDDEK